jgi:hypothetical protein
MFFLVFMSSQSLRMSPGAYWVNQKQVFRAYTWVHNLTYIYCNYVRGIRPALKQYLCRHKFKISYKVESVEAPFVITQDKDYPQIKSDVVCESNH